MLLSLQSTGPRYNHIQTNIQIPWNCEYIKYHVECVNTKNILTTTDEDMIEYEYDDANGNPVKVVVNFTNRYHIGIGDMTNMLRHVDLNLGSVINVMTITEGHLTITPNVNGFKFTKISHRAGLVTGLYNAELNKVYPPNVTVRFEIPIRDYANKLYLVSKQGQSIKSNIGDREYNPSIIANIDHVIGPGIPIIANFEFLGKPIKNIVNIDSFKQIELELVDFQYQPIPLESPMFVTIKVKPCMNPQMRLKE